MKKRLVALVLTGLTFAMFASAGPGARPDEVKLKGTAATTSVDRGRYIVKTAGCNDCHTPGCAQSAGQTEEQHWLVEAP